MPDSEHTTPPFTPGPQSHDTNVICPHCGHAYQAEGEDISEQTRRIDCDECGKPFTTFASISVTYHTTP